MTISAHEINQTKEEMCEVGRRIWQKSFCAGNEGNHSVRIDDTRILCTPTMQSKGFLTPEMICMIDIDGQPLDINHPHRPSSEVKIHLALYQHDSAIKSVIHSHPPHAVAFAISGLELPEGIATEAELFLGRVNTAEYATPGQQALADNLIPAVKKGTNTILMKNHGVVTFGKALMQTYYNLEILDAYCKILLLNRSLGQISPLSEAQMTALFQAKQSFGLEDERQDLKPGWLQTRNKNLPQ